MQTVELIESLKEHIESLNTEKIEKIDFDQLQEELKAVVETLILLGKKENLCDQLFSDFKSDIKRMSVAISRAKGDLNSSRLVEKLLSSENLSFDELVLLREKVREDFNKTFPVKPQAKIVDKLSFEGFQISEFKTGWSVKL